MNDLTNNTDTLVEHISNIVAELYDSVSLIQGSEDQNAVHTYIENYTKRIREIGLRLSKSNFTALRDSCVIFHEILNELNSKRIPLTEDQLQKFEIWPTLLIAYISEPDNIYNIDCILSFLQEPIWEYQINKDDFSALKDDFNSTIDDTIEAISSPNQEELSSKEDEMSGGAFDGAIFESVQEEILESMTGLLSDLASTDDDDDFGLGHAFSLCADRIELLGMSIATAGLIGLMDVCTIFQSGLRELARREKPLTDKEQVIIEEWTSHFIAYLSNPTDRETVDKMVDDLNRIPWSEDLSEDEVKTLLFMLIPEDIEVTAPIELDMEEATISQTENELIYEMENTEGLAELSISEDKYSLGQELIQLIRDEFQLEQPLIDESINSIEAEIELSKENIIQLSEFKQMVERFSLATESIGLTGLNNLLTHIILNLDTIINSKMNKPLSNIIVLSLKEFSKNSLNYLNNMDNPELINILISSYYHESWPVQITTSQQDLEKILLSPQLMIEDDIEIRATQATIDDVSLKLPEDVNQQLLSTLLQELPIQTEEFTQSITQLVEGNATFADVEKAQRIAHTLKGAANTVGIVGIATFTHHIEDIFNAFTTHKRLPGNNLADILMNSADVLEMMSESLLGQGEVPEQAQDVLQQILDWANLIDQQGIPEDDAIIQSSENTSEKPADEMTHLKDIVAPTMLRVPATLMDELLRIAGESIILGGQLQERLRKATEQTKLAHEQNIVYQQLVFELEQLVDVQGLSTKKSSLNSNEVFDSLELEQYNELHTVTHRLVEAATDSKELTHGIEDELHALENLLVDQSRLHKENQNTVMQTRMVPVQNIVPRLQRNVRQTSRTTKKNASLNVIGSETLMDSDVLDELIDPLMHILRNAIDHGIENEDSRKKKNKNLTGSINLTFSRDGDHIVVRCKDDGAGLDFYAIKNTAIQKGIITKEADLSEEELTRLIWMAGFTTRDITTQISGRGIGMDAIYSQITAMKGTITINSIKNKGCTVEIRLPVTLISVHAILIKLRKQTIAVSNRGIEQILCPDDGKLVRDNDKYTYHLNGDVYPAFDIETLLHQPRDQRAGDREERSVFILRDETGFKSAIAIEHVISNQDLIVKQLGVCVPNILGIEGATILGDGSVAPVLDLPGLIRTLSSNDISPFVEQRLAHNDAEEETIKALIVDDSLSARRSLAEFVKDLGYDVRMARDGIEAIEMVEKTKPDILLVDLEMPRMNGLELATHIRSKADTKDIPIIMITSRSTDKHRDMADSAGVNAYLTKPFSEDELLENIQNLLLVVND